MFEIYDNLPFADQLLHHIHFMLCGAAVLIACLPLLTPKGSDEHKFGGMIYVPVAAAAFLVASVIAWREASLVLLCFNGFCAYLLLSGWRAVHEEETPVLIDWLIPAGLFLMSAGMALHAALYDEGKRSFYLMFFAVNGLYLVWRDFRHLRHRAYWNKRKVVFANIRFGEERSGEWLNRHIAGMVGSFMANLSVVVLTLLPLELHWIWPVTLIALAAGIALQQHRRKLRLRAVVLPFLPQKSNYGVVRPRSDEDIRKAA